MRVVAFKNLLRVSTSGTFSAQRIYRQPDVRLYSEKSVSEGSKGKKVKKQEDEIVLSVNDIRQARIKKLEIMRDSGKIRLNLCASSLNLFFGFTLQHKG